MALIPLLSVLLISGCTTELLDTIDQMVDYANRKDKVAPEVGFTSPSYGKLGVPRNTKISVTFDERMNPATINESTVIVHDGASNVAGTVSYFEAYNMALFTPDALLIPSWGYTAKITTGAEDFVGNSIASEYAWLFQTGSGEDTTAPGVDVTFPLNAATGVGVNAVVSASFDEALDPSTIDASTFSLTDESGSVEGLVSYIDSSRTILFEPFAHLAETNNHTATVKAGVKDLCGNARVSDYSWSFQTAAISDIIPPEIVSVDPEASDVDVGITENIVVSFNEPMNSETINGANFYLKSPSGTVLASVSYNPSTYAAILNPLADLQSSTIYTVYVMTGIEDASGNPLASGSIWSFVTKSSETTVTALNAEVVRVDNSAGSGKLKAFVDVTDQNAKHISGLTRYHFALEECINGGTWEDISSASISLGTQQQSKSVALLVDTSASMSYFWAYYKITISNFLMSLGPYDKAMIITFISPSGAPNITLKPSTPTTDMASLIAYLDYLEINYSYTHLWDAAGQGMESLYNQGTDPFRGLDAVISFTDANPSTIRTGIWNNSSCISYSLANDIPIWSIAHLDARYVSELSALATSGYYFETGDPGQIDQAYTICLESMNSMLRNVYTLTWRTQAVKGDTVEVRVAVTYSNANGTYTDLTNTYSYVVP